MAILGAQVTFGAFSSTTVLFDNIALVFKKIFLIAILEYAHIIVTALFDGLQEVK